MANLNIAMISGIRPMPGSGNGITEYAYNMYLRLRKKNNVKLVYAIDRAKKNDVVGLVKINSRLSSKVKAAGRRSYDIFHVVDQEVGFTAQDLKKMDHDNRVVTTVHDISRFEKGLHRGMLQNAYNSLVRRSVNKAISNSDFLIFDSIQAMEEIRKKFRIGRNYEVVNIGVKDSLIRRPKTKQIKDKKFNVGYIGSFAYHKNVSLLLEAANIIDNDWYTFSVYGNGVEYKRLNLYKKLHNLNSVKLMGFASEDRKLQIYDGFDAFVFPSLYEGFGLPILEAQARGLPVIIYKNGRISEEVRRYCFEAKDAAHMASIIDDLRENGYDGKLKKKATEYARSFTWARCAEKTYEIYNKVMG